LTFQLEPFDLKSDTLGLAWLNEGEDEIVPFSLYEFLRSAMVCYRAGHYLGAIALAAIAFEASLKEALKKAGRLWIEEQQYKLTPGRIDAYRQGEDVRLEITIKGATMDFREYFNNQSPKDQEGRLGSVKFNIRRKQNYEDPSIEHRELALIPKPLYRDLFASNLRDIPKRKKADRFIQYIQLAEKYGYFQEAIFSGESADVLRQVRNKIVHWDEKNPNELIGGMLLSDYIQEPRRVRTILADLAWFVSYLFEEAEEAGEKAT
jgi:hypothetical protein